MDRVDGGLSRMSQLARHITRSQGDSKYERLHRINFTEPVEWRQISVEDAPFEDILYEKGEGIARVTINRPESLNSFTPKTVAEMEVAFNDARDAPEIGVVILTGQGSKAFCSGGDLQIRRMPKPVIAMIAGYAVGGGNTLHLVCDLAIAADNAVFGQSGPKIGSFDAGYGISTMVHMIGARKTRELWFLARLYNAQEALSMGLVNAVVPLDTLEQETVKWCREILSNSPTALRVLKSATNATEGSSDLQALASAATSIFYPFHEAEEGRRAYLEGRRPDFWKFNRLP